MRQGVERSRSFLAALLAVALSASGGCADGGAGSTDASGDAAAPWGPFPAAPAAAAAVLYVDGTAPAAGADGSAAHPYPTIGAAIAAATPGMAILIAPGTYEEALRVDAAAKAPLHVVGYRPDAGTEAAPAVILRAAADDGAVIVLGPGGGVPDAVALVGLAIEAPRTAGIIVSAAAVTIEDCAVTDARVNAAGAFGYGIVGFDGADVTVRRSLVRGSASTGILLSDAAGRVTDGCVIEGNAAGGLRLEVCRDAVTVEDSTFRDNGVLAVGVFGSTAVVTGNDVSGSTAPAEGAGYGDGILVARLDDPATGPSRASDVELVGNDVRGCARLGVLLDRGAVGTVVDNVVEENERAGLWIQGAAAAAGELVVQGNRILGNAQVGIGVTGGARVVIQDNRVGETTEFTTWPGVEPVSVGDGIGVYNAAAATVRDNEIVPSDRLDLLFDGAAAGTTVLGNRPSAAGASFAIVIQHEPPGVAIDVQEDGGAAVDRRGADETPYPLMREAAELFDIGEGGTVPDRPE